MISPSFWRRLSQFGSNPCFMAPAGKHRAQMKTVVQLVVSTAASYHVLASRYRWGSQEFVSIEAHMLSLSPLYCPPWPARSEVGGRAASRVWMCTAGSGAWGPRDLLLAPMGFQSIPPRDKARWLQQHVVSSRDRISQLLSLWAQSLWVSISFEKAKAGIALWRDCHPTAANLWITNS